MEFKPLRLVPAVVCASSLIAGCLAAGPALASSFPSGTPRSEGLDVTSSLSPVLAAGNLSDSRGTRAAAGTTVELRAWPTTRAMSGWKPGHIADLILVGTGQTTADGSFVVRRGRATLPQDYANADGTVSLELTAPSFGPASFAFTSAAVVPAAAAARRAAVFQTPTTVDLRSLSAYSSSKLGLSSQARRCGQTHYVKDLGPQRVRVGQGYTTSKVTMDFVYEDGSTSSLGAAVSASGKKGSFKASGTSTASSTATINFPAVTKKPRGRIWSTYFRYGLFKTLCIYPGGQPFEGPKIARVTGFTGGTSIYTLSTYVPPVSKSHCTTFNNGSSFRKVSSRATSYSTGVSASDTLGIDLSSSTGYTQTAEMRFAFHKKAKLCGTNGDPGDAPGVLVAK